jgi:hypothetical protein
VSATLVRNGTFAPPSSDLWRQGAQRWPVGLRAVHGRPTKSVEYRHRVHWLRYGVITADDDRDTSMPKKVRCVFHHQHTPRPPVIVVIQTPGDAQEPIESINQSINLIIRPSPCPHIRLVHRYILDAGHYRLRLRSRRAVANIPPFLTRQPLVPAYLRGRDVCGFFNFNREIVSGTVSHSVSQCLESSRCCWPGGKCPMHAGLRTVWYDSTWCVPLIHNVLGP